VNAESSRRVVVEPGGTRVAAHVGLHALGTFADWLCLGDVPLSCLPWAGRGIPLHERGKVLGQIALMRAGGGDDVVWVVDVVEFRTVVDDSDVPCDAGGVVEV